MRRTPRSSTSVRLRCQAAAAPRCGRPARSAARRTVRRAASPEDLLDSYGRAGTELEVDDQPGHRQDEQRKRPEHREDETAVAERLPTVEAVKERFVDVGVGSNEGAGLQVDYELLVFAACRFACEDRDRRLVALELQGDLVNGGAAR